MEHTLVSRAALPSVGDNVRVTQQPPSGIEYIDVGGVVPEQQAPAVRKPRRWLPVIAGAVTFLLVLVTVGIVVGDAFARNIEMRSLVARVEASETAMGSLQEDVQEILGDYEGRAPLSDEDQAALDERLKAAAAAGRDAIAAAGEDVEALRWLAWHREIGAAQDAYLAHNRAWVDYMDRAAKDPAEFGQPQDDVNSTFEAAEDYFRTALPPLALFDLADRVDVIFAPPPAEDGSSQAA
jgi:hypothetical protein